MISCFDIHVIKSVFHFNSSHVWDIRSFLAAFFTLIVRTRRGKRPSKDTTSQSLHSPLKQINNREKHPLDILDSTHPVMVSSDNLINSLITCYMSYSQLTWYCSDFPDLSGYVEELSSKLTIFTMHEAAWKLKA